MYPRISDRSLAVQRATADLFQGRRTEDTRYLPIGAKVRCPSIGDAGPLPLVRSSWVQTIATGGDGLR